MEISELSELVNEAGFIKTKGFSDIECSTKPVKSRSEFLRQYFEGSLEWLGKSQTAWKKQFNNLVDNDELGEMGNGEEGNITFDIKMNVVLARRHSFNT